MSDKKIEVLENTLGEIVAAGGQIIYDPVDDAFFCQVNGEVINRLCGEHEIPVSAGEFDTCNCIVELSGAAFDETSSKGEHVVNSALHACKDEGVLAMTDKVFIKVGFMECGDVVVILRFWGDLPPDDDDDELSNRLLH